MEKVVRVCGMYGENATFMCRSSVFASLESTILDARSYVSAGDRDT